MSLGLDWHWSDALCAGTMRSVLDMGCGTAVGTIRLLLPNSLTNQKQTSRPVWWVIQIFPGMC